MPVNAIILSAIILLFLAGLGTALIVGRFSDKAQPPESRLSQARAAALSERRHRCC